MSTVGLSYANISARQVDVTYFYTMTYDCRSDLSRFPIVGFHYKAICEANSVNWQCCCAARRAIGEVLF